MLESQCFWIPAAQAAAGRLSGQVGALCYDEVDQNITCSGRAGTALDLQVLLDLSPLSIVGNGVCVFSLPGRGKKK